MKELIISKLRSIALERGFSILHANESGSRAWGFPSLDSDYDVRFIYSYPFERYVDLRSPRETFTTIDGDLDIVGWDIRKYARLLHKSNASAIEWINSPIVYMSRGEFQLDVKTFVMNHFSSRNAIAHYLGLMTSHYNRYIADHDDVIIKKYMYAIRCLLSAQHVYRERTPPPVNMDEFPDQHTYTMTPETEQMFAWLEYLRSKKNDSESTTVKRIKRVDQEIYDWMSFINYLEPIDMPASLDAANALMVKWVKSVSMI